MYLYRGANLYTQRSYESLYALYIIKIDCIKKVIPHCFQQVSLWYLKDFPHGYRKKFVYVLCLFSLPFPYFIMSGLVIIPVFHKKPKPSLSLSSLIAIICRIYWTQSKSKLLKCFVLIVILWLRRMSRLTLEKLNVLTVLNLIYNNFM